MLLDMISAWYNAAMDEDEEVAFFTGIVNGTEGLTLADLGEPFEARAAELEERGLLRIPVS